MSSDTILAVVARVIPRRKHFSLITESTFLACRRQLPVVVTSRLHVVVVVDVDVVVAAAAVCP